MPRIFAIAAATAVVALAGLAPNLAEAQTQP